VQRKGSDSDKLERQSMICAILSFPLMLMAAVGLDVALVIVSLYPDVAFFIGFESVMPAYFAYRILVEVVLEALPQVLFQSEKNNHTRFVKDVVIMISIACTVLTHNKRPLCWES
jgi:hypothetical protein